MPDISETRTRTRCCIMQTLGHAINPPRTFHEFEELQTTLPQQMIDIQPQRDHDALKTLSSYRHFLRTRISLSERIADDSATADDRCSTSTRSRCEEDTSYAHEFP
ncbi:hypothetical protein SMMN14_07871 [Sphaerulina musiva]